MMAYLEVDDDEIQFGSWVLLTTRPYNDVMTPLKLMNSVVILCSAMNKNDRGFIWIPNVIEK
jgi:hypothetical protein